MTIDYTRLYIFIGIVALLVIAVIANIYINLLNEDDEETFTDTVDIKCYNDSHRIVPNGTAEFVFHVENSAESDTSNFIKLEVVEKSPGWEAYFENPFLRIDKESRALGFLTVKGNPDYDSGIFNFTVRATSTTFEGSSTAYVFVMPEPKTDDRVVESMDYLTADYVGYLDDGRIFDTSVASVAFSDVPKTDDFQVRGSESDYSAFSFTHDNEPRDVIPGFDAGVAGMMIDQTKVIIVPPSQGYTQEGHALYGKTLYFELTLDDIERS